MALALAGLALLVAGYFVDRMALGYLTGQRRTRGRDFLGSEVRADGAVPGFAFLGFTEASESPPGLLVRQPFESGREIGLEPGDVVTAVDGKLYRDGRELMRAFLRERAAGDVVTLTVAGGSSRPARELKLVLKPFLRHPGDLGLSYQEVEISSDSGFTLRGWYIPPPATGDGRAGVFVHGAKSSRFQGLDGALHWHRRGYGLLAMDLSGRGTSGGDYVTYTVHERKDVASMVRWLRARSDVRPDRVVVFGTSNGAAAAIYAAAADPTPPPLVLDAPFSDLWAEAAEMLRARGAPPLLRYPLGWAVRLRAGVDLRRVRPIEVVDRVKAPVLFIHGDRDREVLPYHTERLAAARRAAGLPTERWVIPGGEHGFDHYPPVEAFWGRILDFFDRALAGAPGE
jgi:dipeptidyl aminopeptidase/acylaminoacyl peptidase